MSVFSAPIVQPKLTVNQSNDNYEQEAKAVADKLIQTKVSSFHTPFFKPKQTITPVQRHSPACEDAQFHHTSTSSDIQRKYAFAEDGAHVISRKEDDDKFQMKPAASFIQRKYAAAKATENVISRKDDDKLQVKPAASFIRRKCAACDEEKDKAYRKASVATLTPSVTPSVHQTLASAGQPMDKPTRTFMEQRFGCDFKNVQIHDDSLAHESSADINAHAYTNREHIVFAAGQYVPDSIEGKKLLAHELAHVVQQTPALSNPTHDTNTLMRSPDPEQGAKETLPRMTNEQLIQRSKEIYTQAVTNYLTQRGKPATKELLNILKAELTIGVLQGTKDGKLITIVNGNSPRFTPFIKNALKSGETLIESISVIPTNVRTGEPRISGFVNVHAEQVLAAEALTAGIKNSRVATSNLGCDALCLSNLRQHYPGVTHVNPKVPQPAPSTASEVPVVAPKGPPPIPAKGPVTAPAVPKTTAEVGAKIEPVNEATPGYTPGKGAGIGGAFQILQSKQFSNLQQDEVSKFQKRFDELQPKIDAYLNGNNSVELIVIAEVPNSRDVLCPSVYCDQGQFIYFRGLYISRVESLKPLPIPSFEPKPYATMSASGRDAYIPYTHEGGSVIEEKEIPFLSPRDEYHHCEYRKITLNPTPQFSVIPSKQPEAQPVKTKPKLDEAARVALASAPSRVSMLTTNIIQYKTAQDIAKKINDPLLILNENISMGGGYRKFTRVIYWSNLDKPRAEKLAEIIRANGLPSTITEIGGKGDAAPGNLQINFGDDAETEN